MTCHNCGADNPPTFHFCQNCGTELELVPASPNPPPFTKFRRSRRGNNNSLLLGAIGAGAIACVCVCGLVLAWFYIAQNTASAQPAARPSPTRRVTSTPALDASQDQGTSTATNQPMPSSGSATAVAPSATFNKWQVTQVESAFQAARLEFSNPRPMTNDDYGNVPRVAKQAIRFFLPSLGGQKGGRVYSFATANDLQTVKQYYESGQSGAATKPWIFVKDNILVQFTGDLPENRATQYKNALNGLR